MEHRVPRWTWSWWALAFVLLPGAVFFAYRFTRSPLPDVCQVESMTARVDYSSRGLPVIPEFPVPPEHVDRILSALTPARRDRSRTKWIELGKLVLHLKDGRIMHVRLNTTFQDRGAFSVGTYPDYTDLVSYRGGTDAGIEDAVRQAYAEATGRASR